MELKPGRVPQGLTKGPAFELTAFPAPHRWATRGEPTKRAFGELAERFAHPELWPGTGTTEAAEHRLPAWTFARFRDDTRVVTRDLELSDRETRARVLEVHGLIVDYVDEPAADGEALLHWWGDYAFLAHTTGFHELEMGERPPGPRWRLWIPFLHPVPPARAAEVAEWARHPRHDVGIVAPQTDAFWRVAAMPALSPGGYRWLGGRNDPLDPDAAVRELHTWQSLDVRVRAEQALEGTELAGAIDRLVKRRRRPVLRTRFPVPRLPGLAELLEPLWPGRILGIVGTGGSGRSSLALQFASASADAGMPVLLVLTRMGGDEALARLVGQRTGLPAKAILAGEGVIDGAVQELAAQADALHLWTPRSEERTLQRLTAIVSATSQAHQGAPVLVVVDGVEGWAVGDPEVGARTLLSGLRDVAHAGTLRADWPGAAVVFVGGLDGPAMGPRRLRARWEEGVLDLGALEPDAAAMVVVAVQGDEALAVVAKNRDGRCGEVPLGFVPGRGFVPEEETT